MELVVTGGGYVTAGGYGRMGDGGSVALREGRPIQPAGRDIFEHPPARYGRFDAYTKMGLAAAALALHDAGLAESEGKRPIGMVTASCAETLATDAAYYESTLEEGGAFASPNLFSYTLPGIVQGECAVLFQMTGPTFCVGEDGRPGRTALVSAAMMLEAGKASAMLAGWIESPLDAVAESRGFAGALFVVVESAARKGAEVRRRLRFCEGRVAFEGGRPVVSLIDLFHPRPQGEEA